MGKSKRILLTDVIYASHTYLKKLMIVLGDQNKEVLNSLEYNIICFKY